MTLSVGSRLPDADLLHKGAGEPEKVALGAKLKGRNVVIFGLPGAFTGTCTMAHVPSFIRAAARLREKGVDEIVCVAVNDPFVMKAWGEATGATAAGITMLGDADASFTKSIGMAYSAPGDGFHDRSRRYALYAVDGVVKVLNFGDTPGTCDVSGGEVMLDAI